MTLRTRVGAAWTALFKDAGDSDFARVYGPLAPFVEVYGTRATKSGAVVNWQTALQVATVLACVRVLADGVAQVPLKLYRERNDNRGSDPATDHPLYNVLYRRPNPWQTSFEFRETMMLHTVLCGNFYAFKNRIGREIREIIPFEPGHVEVKRLADYSLVYRVRNDGGQYQEFPQEAILHVRGPSWNSWMGMEAVKLARESIGLSMAIEGDQAQLYANGLRTAGVFSLEGKLSDEQYKKLRKWIDEHAAKPGGPLILDNAAKFLQTMMTGVDAQTLESRRLQIEEVCRPFRVMPIMIGHSDKTATYASSEQMFLAHAVHTMGPWYERLQQTFDVQLLDPTSDAGLYIKFVVNALMRGTHEARAKFYQAMLGSTGQKGWGTPNEVRELEEMNLSDESGADSIAPPVQAKPAALPPPGV